MRGLLASLLISLSSTDPATPAAAVPAQSRVDLQPVPPNAASPACGEYVLVSQGTPLLAEPLAGEVLADLVARGPSLNCGPQGLDPAVWVMRVVASHGETVEVETLGQPADERLHCADTSERRPWRPHALWKYRLRLFVPRASLLPVVRSEVRVVAADGSTVWVRPGLPVRRTPGPAGQTRYSLEDLDDEGDRQLSLQVALPDSAVGLSYWLGDWSIEAMNSGPEGEVSRSHMLREHGPALRVGDIGEVRSSPAWLDLYQGQKKGAYLASHQGRCVKLQAKVARSQVRRIPPPEGIPDIEGGVVTGGAVGGVIGCVIANPDSWEAEAGARLYWPDGRRAGSLLAREELRGPPRESPSGHRCFEVKLEQSPTRLPLCLEPAEVHPEQAACVE